MSFFGQTHIRILFHAFCLKLDLTNLTNENLQVRTNSYTTPSIIPSIHPTFVQTNKYVKPQIINLEEEDNETGKHKSR